MSLTSAKEGTTYIITYAFFDEAGSAISPISAVWSLRDNNGKIVNNRSTVSIVSPTTSGSVVLTKDDLIYEPNSSTFRIFTISATYNGIYGSACTVVGEDTFNIDPYIGV